MTDYLTLGPTPAGENCVQVGNDNYQTLAREECKKYIALLRKKWPEANFRIKSFPHDFGSYMEVVVMYDTENEKETDQAFDIENNLPESWQ